MDQFQKACTVFHLKKHRLCTHHPPVQGHPMSNLRLFLCQRLGIVIYIKQFSHVHSHDTVTTVFACSTRSLLYYFVLQCHYTILVLCQTSKNLSNFVQYMSQQFHINLSPCLFSYFHIYLVVCFLTTLLTFLNLKLSFFENSCQSNLEIPVFPEREEMDLCISERHKGPLNPNCLSRNLKSACLFHFLCWPPCPSGFFYENKMPIG